MNFYMCVLRCDQKLNFHMLLYNVHITCDVWSLTPSPVTTMYNNQHYYSKHLPIISDWLKGHCHAIWQLYKKPKSVFASVEFQN